MRGSLTFHAHHQVAHSPWRPIPARIGLSLGAVASVALWGVLIRTAISILG